MTPKTDKCERGGTDTRPVPTCEVETEGTGHETTDSGDGLRVETKGGVLGNLPDVKGSYLTASVCPACSLVRFRAE